MITAGLLKAGAMDHRRMIRTAVTGVYAFRSFDDVVP
jgi:hypothetical protein